MPVFFDMDNYFTLSQRLQLRAPQVGNVLAGQLVNDAWRTLQARKDWSWRRRSNTFAPPNLYSAGQVSTNVATGSAFLITGTSTAWSPTMIGSQIRAGGLLYPYYTITAVLSPTSLVIDQAWAGADITAQAYQILQCYYPVPADFGYFEVAVSIKDGYRLFIQATQEELALMDPQRTDQGQTYAAAFRDFTSNFSGTIGPVIGVSSATDPAPISITTLGYSYPGNASYIVQVVTGGATGTATFQWLRVGQTSFQGPVITSDQPQDLSDGVQVYWPDAVAYVANDLFIVNCQSLIAQGVPRYELWPAPTYNGYLYPYIYFAKESDMTPESPALPAPIANRGEVVLELALEKCALFPGASMESPNPYFNLQLASYHRERSEMMIEDLLSNDQNIGVSNITYNDYPFAGPWADGSFQQSHAPWLG